MLYHRLDKMFFQLSDLRNDIGIELEFPDFIQTKPENSTSFLIIKFHSIIWHPNTIYESMILEIKLFHIMYDFSQVQHLPV